MIYWNASRIYIAGTVAAKNYRSIKVE